MSERSAGQWSDDSEWSESEKERLTRPPVPASAERASHDIGDAIGDSTRMYLAEIGETPLLTHEEEIELAKRVAGGGEDGERAFEQFAKANLRLVVSIAKNYSHTSLSLLDLIQEGNTGLMIAIRKFDHKKGFRFSTYGSWWIRQAITSAIGEKSTAIRIPSGMNADIRALDRAREEFRVDFEREPTSQELAEQLGIKEDRVAAMETARSRRNLISLEFTVRGDDSDMTLADSIADRDTIQPEENAVGEMLKRDVREVLAQLNDRERIVLEGRYGFNGDTIRTLEDIGQELGISRERVRQIEEKAKNTMLKLGGQGLRGYLS